MLPSVCCLADARLVRLFPAVGRWGSSGLLAVLVAPAAETKKPRNRLHGCVAKRWLAPRKIHAFLNSGKVLQQGRCRQDKPRKKASLCPPHLPRKNDRNWRKSGGIYSLGIDLHETLFHRSSPSLPYLYSNMLGLIKCGNRLLTDQPMSLKRRLTSPPIRSKARRTRLLRFSRRVCPTTAFRSFGSARLPRSGSSPRMNASTAR